MLYHVVRRASRARLLDAVAVATSIHSDDDPLELFCRDAGVPCFRGSLNDVLDRFYRASVNFDSETVVRITADCPLLDPAVIDLVVSKFREGGYDYVSNTIECTYPDGLDIEVFSRHALERAWKEAALSSEREHVTPYFYKNPDLFRLANVRAQENLSHLRWTVDEPGDLEFVRAVYDALGDTDFGMEDVLSLLMKFPEMQDKNVGIARNEGYRKSLNEDG